MGHIEDVLGEKFVCHRCGSPGGKVEKLAMTGTGLSRWFEIQHHRYAFVSCQNCGFTEVFNLKMLEGKDSLGTFLEVLFAD